MSPSILFSDQAALQDAPEVWHKCVKHRNPLSGPFCFPDFTGTVPSAWSASPHAHFSLFKVYFTSHRTVKLSLNPHWAVNHSLMVLL